MASLSEIKIRIDTDELKKIVTVICDCDSCIHYLKDSGYCNLKKIMINEKGECVNKCLM